MFVKNYGNLQDIELLLCDLTDAGYNDDADVSEEGSDDGNIVDIGTLVPLLFDDDEAGRAAMMQPDKIVVMVRKSIISHATTCRVLARSGEEQQQLISWAVKSRTSEYIFEPQGKLQERHVSDMVHHLRPSLQDQETPLLCRHCWGQPLSPRPDQLARALVRGSRLQARRRHRRLRWPHRLALPVSPAAALRALLLQLCWRLRWSVAQTFGCPPTATAPSRSTQR